MIDKAGQIVDRLAPCDHDWRPTGMFLMKMADVHSHGRTVGRRAVGGLEGYFGHQTPQVQACARCGLLRLPPVPDPSGDGRR